MRAVFIVAWSLILTAQVFAEDTNAVPAILYVSPSGSSVAPYDTLATAATNIQDAVDAAAEGDTLRVDAGTYFPGEEVIIAGGITLESIHGADASELVAGTDPTDAADCFRITALDDGTLWFPTVLDRHYTLEASTNLVTGGWYSVTNQVGNGSEIQLTDPSTNPAAFYRVRVE